MSWYELYGRLREDVNDPAAWAALEHRARRWALRAFRQRGWDAVEDAVADTCASIVMSFAQARGVETFSGFSYGQYLNVKRRMCAEARETHVPLDEAEHVRATAVSVGTVAPSEAQLAALRRGLESLPARERLAVELRYLQEHTAAEIARKLGVTEGNARRIVFNGLSRLRRQLRRDAPAGSRPALAGATR